VIEEVDCPVDHNNVPVAVVERIDVPQLFTTVTTGTEGPAPGLATPDPIGLTQPFVV
jgi:hypothetical protein